MHYIRFWLELTACLPGRARSVAQLRDSACGRFIILTLCLGLLQLLDLLMRYAAFGVHRLELPWSGRQSSHGSYSLARPVGLCTVAQRSPRLHMCFAGCSWVVQRHIAPIWDQALVPLRSASDGRPQLWWDRPADRLLAVSGWLDDRFLGQAGHFMGVAWSGVVLCPRFGQVVVGDVEGAPREILRQMPLEEEFSYFLLPPQGAEGEWQGAQPLPPSSPCCAWEVGRRRLFLAASTAAADWAAHRTPVPAFVDKACACRPLHP